MIYRELKKLFQELKQTKPIEILTAHIVFTEDNFAKKYPLLSRTYRINSDEKVFWPSMAGYSLFGYCLDGTDWGVRLDYYMEEERANTGGWRVEDCYILEHMRDTAAMSNVQRQVQDDGSICYFFGDTSIRVIESIVDDKLCLKPVAGDQAACGKWVALTIDKVYGYCALLEQYFNHAREQKLTIHGENTTENPDENN